MAYIFTNAGSAVITSGGTGASTAGTVESWTATASACPVTGTSGSFVVVDVADSGTHPELMLVTSATNGTGVTWTVTRGAEGSTTVAHTTGFTVKPVISAAVLSALLQGIQDAYNMTYDPTGSGFGTIDPIPAYRVSKALDYLNVHITDATEMMYLLTKRDTLYAVYALADANPNLTVDGLIPGFKSTIPTLAPVTTSTSAVTLLDPVGYPLQDVTLTSASVAISVPVAVSGVVFDLAIRQDGTGSRTVTWPAVTNGTLKWPAATAPTISTAANTVDLIRFRCTVSGTWLAVRTSADHR